MANTFNKSQCNCKVRYRHANWILYNGNLFNIKSITLFWIIRMISINSFATSTTGYHFFIPYPCTTGFGKIHQWGLFSRYTELGPLNSTKNSRDGSTIFVDLDQKPRSTATYWFYTTWLFTHVGHTRSPPGAVPGDGVSEPGQYWELITISNRSSGGALTNRVWLGLASAQWNSNDLPTEL
jgi:hypothetical protein